MNDFNEPGFLAPTGLYLGGTKYLVIQGEPGAVIRGKKVIFFVLHILIAFSITSISTFDLFQYPARCSEISIGVDKYLATFQYFESEIL